MNRSTRVVTLGVACAYALLAPTRGAAQVARLDGRVSESVRAQVRVLADSLARSGLPADPIVDKALEGTSKRAGDQRIIAAVRAVAADLRTAQKALGTATAAEFATAAAALHAGVSPSALTQMRRALGDRSLVVPLSVLSALVVQGVPAADAQVAVLAQARVNDQRVLAFGRDVRHAIDAGVPPAQALTVDGTTATSSASPMTDATGQPRGSSVGAVVKVKPKP